MINLIRAPDFEISVEYKIDIKRATEIDYYATPLQNFVSQTVLHNVNNIS